MPVFALRFHNARVFMSGCGVVGSIGHGLFLSGGSTLEMDHCLVSATNGIGIDIAGPKLVRAKIADTDVRNCAGIGLRIRNASDSVEVARCRFRDIGQQAIRYEDASPSIHENLFVDDLWGAILASGETAAMVEGNVFLRSGVRLAARNEDTFERNTFVFGKRIGLAVSATAAPTVRQNLFSDCDPAIHWSYEPRARPESENPLEAGRLRGNIFWNNKVNVRLHNQKLAGQISRIKQTIEKAELQCQSMQLPPRLEGELRKLLLLLDNTSSAGAEVLDQAKRLREVEKQYSSNAEAVRSKIAKYRRENLAPLEKELNQEVVLKPAWGNLQIDPRFVGADGQDYSLAADSPARKAQVGVAQPLSLKSPWPLLPEEKAFVTAREAAEDLKWRPAPRRQIVVNQRLVDDLCQKRDSTLRKLASRTMQRMLREDAPDSAKVVAVNTLRSAIWSGGVESDRYRELVKPLLGSRNSQIREGAMHCLMRMRRSPTETLALARSSADDSSPEIRILAGHLLRSAVATGEQEQEVLSIFTKLLHDPDSRVVSDVLQVMLAQKNALARRQEAGVARRTSVMRIVPEVLGDANPEVFKRLLGALSGRYSSPELDEVLIARSRDARYRKDAIEIGLAPLHSKSPSVCRRLVEEVETHGDGMALKGLKHGVTDEARAVVEDGMLRILSDRVDAIPRASAIEVLSGVASEKSRSYLKSVIDSETTEEREKWRARNAMRTIDRRKRSN
jgi:hypothetical protein